MRIALVDARRAGTCTLKDVAGGFGTVFEVGRSLPARVLQRAKGHMAGLPLVTLAYLQRLLIAEGAEVLVLELSGAQRLPPADLYLIASSIVAHRLELEIAREARRLRARVGVFGVFAGRCPEAWAGAADFVLRGEPENLARDLARGAPLAGVVEAGFVADLDALPLPDWSGFDLSRSRYRLVTRGLVLPVLGSRGCAYACDYCPYLVDSRFRTRSVDSLLEELAWAVREHGARGVSFRDPLRLFDPGQAERFAEGLQRRGLRVPFSMECRSDRLDGALLSVLRRAGLRSLEIGVESADARTVDAHGRHAPSREQQERVVAHCHRLGIRVIANYLLGLPNDDEAGMRATIRYARRLDTVAVQFTVATPYPGTALHREVGDRILDPDWERWNGWTNVFRHPTLAPDQIHRLRESAYVGYHLRPRYALRLLRSLLS